MMHSSEACATSGSVLRSALVDIVEAAASESEVVEVDDDDDDDDDDDTLDAAAEHW